MKYPPLKTDITKNAKTAGAYVLYQDLFLFQVGPTKDGKSLGVVRLGGHRENDETALETAKREVMEEARVPIIPIHSATTFYLGEWDASPRKVQMAEKIAPILIKGSEETSFTVMYLSYTKIKPQPASETHGLLMLSPSDVHQICHNRLTLNDFLKGNGRAIIMSAINNELLLQPFPQLLFLDKLLKEESKLMKSIYF